MNYEKIKTFTYKYPFLRKLLYPAIAMRRFSLRRKLSYQEMVYQRLCELVVKAPLIRVDEFQGIFVIDCRSALFKSLLIAKNYESQLVRYSLRYIDEKRDAIDVGANIGLYTILFAKKLNEKKVLSIEPTINALDLLYKNIQLNHVENNVIIFEGAASNHRGTAEIKTINGREEYSTLGNWKHPSIFKEQYTSQKVKVETIDELVNRYSLDPGFMKVDTEGMEHIVFDGSRTVLETKRPVILSELSDYLLKENGSSSIDVVNLIKSYEYDIIDPITQNIPPEIKNFTNILCIPKEIEYKKYDHV